MQRLDPRATHLVLDTQGLEITGVDQLSRAVLGATEKLAPFWVSRPFELGRSDPRDGTALVIDLPPSSAPQSQVRVEYRTTAAARGLHWRTTRPGWRGRPFFYVLSEPGGARAWIPLQDTPRAPITLRAHVHTPPQMVALLSGARDANAKAPGEPTAARAADHWLLVERPMPASRLDLVVADLKFDAIGPRDGVYAAGWSARREARALAQAPAVRAAGERLLGRTAPRRDFVAMPEDFPQGLVVTPGLTLLSPTLFGPSSHLVPLAARIPYGDAERAIEPADRGDAWIGRAFAAYLQSRIVEALYGASPAAVSDTLAYLELRARLARLSPSAQALRAGGEARADDAGAQAVDYGKGRLLLELLDASFGRARFDAFMRACFDRFADRPASTDAFVALAEHELLDRTPGVLRPGALEAWIREPGIPANAVLPDADALRAIDAARDGWLSGRSSAAALRARDWPAEDWTYFLASLPRSIDAGRLAELDAAYAPMRSGDLEREALWLRIGLRAGYAQAAAAVPAYLEGVARVDLIAPLYASLMRTPTGAALARRVYSSARAGYDPLATALIDPIVGTGPDADADGADGTRE